MSDRVVNRNNMIPSRKLPRIAYFWPGLPQLWLRGSWAGLAVAVGFTALVNVLVLATFVFHEWIPREQMLGGYAVVAASWLVGWWRSCACRELAGRLVASELSESSLVGESATDSSAVGLASSPGEQLFCEAQRVYLRGDWVAAEQLLLKLLKSNDRDAEARLMLATLWRHQGRHREAQRQLDKLSRLEAADRWEHEIACERQENAAALEHNEDTNTRESQEVEKPQPNEMADQGPSTAETIETNRRLAA
jgi:hypothetical protein